MAAANDKGGAVLYLSFVAGGFKHGTGFSVISDPAESGRLGFTEFELWGPQNLSFNPSGLNYSRN